MKNLILAVIAIIIASSVQAKDKSEVTVVNDDTRPVPVTVRASFEPVSVTESRLIDAAGDGQRSSIIVYEVPEAKVLTVDYVMLFLDVVVGNRPADLRIMGELRGSNPADVFSGPIRFDLGYMDELPFTSRGTPNFVISKPIPVHFGAGPVTCTGETHFGGVNLNFGLVRCALSGRLTDALSQ